EAIAADPKLGQAWLGRGLCRIRNGQSKMGREDLQVAATLEPNRASFRSYLGKAFSEEDLGDGTVEFASLFINYLRTGYSRAATTRARRELALAKKSDP